MGKSIEQNLDAVLAAVRRHEDEIEKIMDCHANLLKKRCVDAVMAKLGHEGCTLAAVDLRAAARSRVASVLYVQTPYFSCPGVGYSRDKALENAFDEDFIKSVVEAACR